MDLHKESPHKESTTAHDPSIFAAASPTPTPLRAVKFGDAPCYKVINGCEMMLRTYHVRMRRHRCALPGRLAPTRPCRRISGLCTSSLSDPALTIFAASSPTSTPGRAIKFRDAPCY